MWKADALCCGRMENEMSLARGNMSSGRGLETGKGEDTARWCSVPGEGLTREHIWLSGYLAQ